MAKERKKKSGQKTGKAVAVREPRGKGAVLKADKRDRSTVSKGRRRGGKAEESEKRSWFRRIVYYGAVAGVWSIIAGVIALGYLAHDLPNLDELPHPGAGDPAIVVKAANGSTLVRQGPIYGDWVPYNEVPDALVWSFLAVEDRQFFSHNGFDGKGFLRAVYTNLTAGRVRAGGSTLTQQLAKNMFLSNVRSFKRKAQELLLAFWLEQKFTKNQIFSLYLNRVYFGGGAYGIDAASQKYFGHSARTLSIAESAMLAGLVQAPTRLAPHINPDGAWNRAQTVLSAMVDNEALSEAAAAKIKRQRPRIITSGAGRDARYFGDWVISKARNLTNTPAGQSLIIYTTLDPAIQRAGALAVERGLEKEGQNQNVSQAALVAIDNDGAVRAMIGGANYADSQYNRAAQAERQPGSAFKIFPYLAALEQGIEISDRYIDERVTIDDWSPKNYSGEFNGEMTLREAFARSINTVAVQVTEKVGRDRVVSMAKRLGIQTNLSEVASLPLGTEEVKLIELAGAYASVANGGFRSEPYSIIEITSLEGEVLYRRTAEPPVPVLTREVAENMTQMMTSVIAWGSGKNAKLDRPAAGKSGTSQDSRDALFAGFTSDITAAVWVGNDDGQPMKYVTGGGLPARIWADFMLDAHAGVQARPLLADASVYQDSVVSTAKKNEDKREKRGFFSRLFGKNSK